MASNLVTRAGAPTTQGESINKGSALTNAELDNNFYPLYVTAGTALAGRALVLDASGDLNINNVGRIDNCETIQFNSEVDNGNSGAAKTITLNTAQKQKVTVSEATTLTLGNPTSVGNWVLKLVNGGAFSITWAASSGAIYWAANTEPTWSSAATDLIAIYYDGTNFYCSASLGFNP